MTDLNPEPLSSEPGPAQELSKEQKLIAFAKKHAVAYVEGEGELITKFDWFAVGLAGFNILSGVILSLLSLIFLIGTPTWQNGLLNGAFLGVHILQIVVGVSIITFSLAMEAVRRVVKSSTKVTDLATKHVPPLALKLALWGAAKFLDARTGLMFLAHWLITGLALLAVGYRLFW